MEMKMIALLVTLIITIVTANPKIGQCPSPTIKPMNSLDLRAFSGSWYNVFELNRSDLKKCNQILIKTTIVAELTEIDYMPDFNETSVIQGLAVIPSNGSSKLEFVAKISPSDMVFPFDLTVLDTDYNNYGIVYVCGKFRPLISFEKISVVSRTPHLDKKFYDKIDSVLKSNSGKGITSLDSVVQDCGQVLCVETDLWPSCSFSQIGSPKKPPSSL